MFDEQPDGDPHGECAAEIARLRADYEGACKTVAEMHFAATGSTDGPRLGVVEDVKALRTALAELVRLDDQYRPTPAPHELMAAWEAARAALDA